MIRITGDPDLPEVRAEGHAGAGPRGQDLVCAAVTALLLTLAQEADRWGGRSRLERGYARIRGTDGCRAQFGMILRGLQLLARQFPEHISCGMTGDREAAEDLVD